MSSSCEPSGVLITGASTGIGRATSIELVAAGYRVFATVRTAMAADDLLDRLGSAVTPIVLDIRDDDAVNKAAASVAHEVSSNGLIAVINNAGIAVGGPWLHIDEETALRPYKVNVIGTLNITRAFLPLLHQPGRSPGRLINISSIAGKLAVPFLGPYAASKHALEALSTSLRGELEIYGVGVVVIAPSIVATPIWQKPDAIRTDGFANTAYGASLAEARKRALSRGLRGISPERVARLVHHVIESKYVRSRYTVGPPGPLARTMLALLPSRIANRAIDQWMNGWFTP